MLTIHLKWGYQDVVALTDSPFVKPQRRITRYLQESTLAP